MAEFGDRYQVGQILPHHAESMRKSAEAKTAALGEVARTRFLNSLVPQSTGPVADQSSPSARFYREYREECPLDPSAVEQKLEANIKDADPYTMGLVQQGHLQRRLRRVLAPRDENEKFIEQSARKRVMARFKAERRAGADLRAQHDEAERLRLVVGNQPEERIAEPVPVLV